MFELLSRKAEICRTWKINASYTFWVPVTKVVLRLYHNIYILLFCIDLPAKPYQGLWFNQKNLSLFRNMSIKIYTNFFLSLGGYNFKINNLKYKSRCEMYFILAEQFNVIPMVTRVLLLAQGVKMLWKSIKSLSRDIWV